jgi:hypothetical protein
MAKFAAGTTAKVLTRGQAALRMESDFELARSAIPASLKTVEGLHVVDPENERLIAILAEGYCQYAAGFVEDEWEEAQFQDQFDRADELAVRATRMYSRCMGYSLLLLGDPWKKALTGDLERFTRMVKNAGPGDRHGLLFLAISLGGSVNMNKDDVRFLAHMGKVKILLERVLELDKKAPPESVVARALPHIALGRVASAIPRALGGKPDDGKVHFARADEVTSGKMLLVPVYMASSYAVATQNRKLFTDSLVKVLQTDPAIWPEERLSNEIAHRRARRYLKREKDWF